MKYLIAFILVIFSVSILAEPIPFDPGRGLVEIDVVVDGHAYGKFGIDTGADRLYIDKVFGKNNYLVFKKSQPQRKIVGLEGDSEAGSISVRSLKISDDETLYNLEATAVDLRSLIKDTTGGVPDGLIGLQILSRFYVSVDYPNKTLELLSFEPSFILERQYYEIPFNQYQHLILVDVTFENNITAPMILDYCASFTTIDKSFADKIDLDSDYSGRQNVSFMALSEDIISTNVPVVVKDYSEFKKSVPRAEFAGILGASYLYQHKITVDYKRKKIYIHKK